MRRGISLATALLLLLAFSLPAVAGAPTTETFSFFGFNCELSGEGGAGFVSVFVEDDEVFADAAIWLPGREPFEDSPDLFSDFESSTATIEGNTVTAILPMIAFDSGEPGEGEGEEPGGEPAGTLTLNGTIGELLEEETFEDRFRDGNRWVEIMETFRIFAAEAEVALDDAPFEAECSADEGEFVVTSTNPQAYRIRSDDRFIDCFGIPDSDGSTLNLFASEFDDTAQLFLEILPPGNGEEGEGEGGPPELFGEAEIPRLSGHIEVTVPLFDPFDGEAPVAEALVVMDIAEGETAVSTIVAQDVRAKQTETELLISGVVMIDDGATYDLSGCSGSAFEVKGLINEASGPKTSGKAPANDTLEGAAALWPGGGDNVQTKATALEPEAACSETFDFGEEGEEEFIETFDLPIGKTVWYSVTGTGDPMTVSTAGSNFDTIVGVYEMVEGELTQVTCVDDVFEAGFSLQAEATWESVGGTTYYIQAGGFGLFSDPEFPEENSNPEYGLLKIAVS